MRLIEKEIFVVIEVTQIWLEYFAIPIDEAKDIFIRKISTHLRSKQKIKSIIRSGAKISEADIQVEVKICQTCFLHYHLLFFNILLFN